MAQSNCMLYLLITGIYIWSRNGVEGLSTGPPASACGTLSPDPVSHGAQPQGTALPPRVLDLSELDDDFDGELSYIPGETYQSMLSTVCP